MDADPRLEVVEAVGRIMEFWGFRKTLGRVWAWLYLAPAPVAAAELCEVLGLSTGAVSMALNDLLRWEAAHRRSESGDRRDFYEAERDVWATVRRVMARRELREVDQALEVFRDAAGRLQDDRAARARVGELIELAAAGQDLLRLLLLPASSTAPGPEHRPRLPRIDDDPDGVR